jgi:hypothetical protein
MDAGEPADKKEQSESYHQKDKRGVRDIAEPR